MAFSIISKLTQIEASSENRTADSVRRPITSSGPPLYSKSISHFLLYKFAQNDVKNRMFRCSVRSVSLLEFDFHEGREPRVSQMVLRADF